MHNLVDIFEAEGITTRKKGGKVFCLCPFHSEKTSSCIVGTERFHCFGCGKDGDAIQFVRDYKGLSYRDALRYLGIADDGDERVAIFRRVNAENRKVFREWCHGERLRIFNHLLALYEVMRQATSILWLEGYGILDDVRLISSYEYYIDILLGNDDKAKFELYRRAKSAGGV